MKNLKAASRASFIPSTLVFSSKNQTESVKDMDLFDSSMRLSSDNLSMSLEESKPDLGVITSGSVSLILPRITRVQDIKETVDRVYSRITSVILDHRPVTSETNR